MRYVFYIAYNYIIIYIFVYKYTWKNFNVWKHIACSGIIAGGIFSASEQFLYVPVFACVRRFFWNGEKAQNPPKLQTKIRAENVDTEPANGNGNIF